MKTVSNVLSERFEVAFNKIQDSMERLLKTSKSFTELVRIGSKHHKIIKEFSDDLLQFARLRNAIVHDKIEIGYYIAEPHEEVVERIEKIADLLSQPSNALSIATKKVIYYFSDDPLLNVIQGMKYHNHSQYPIYNQDRCIGLLKSSTIVKWLADHLDDYSFQLEKVKVSDVFAYEKDHPIIFIPKSYNIFDVEEVYEQFHHKKKDLEMAIITENGRPDEVPLGIITAWDLIAIDYTTD